MRLEIDARLIADAQERYTGARTDASGLVTWLLRAFADRDISQIQANLRSIAPGGTAAQGDVFPGQDHRDLGDERNPIDEQGGGE